MYANKKQPCWAEGNDFKTLENIDPNLNTER